MDPLSISASVASLISLSAQAYKAVGELSQANKAREEYAYLTDRIARLQDTLKRLFEFSESDQRQDWSILKDIIHSQQDVIDSTFRDLESILLLQQDAPSRKGSSRIRGPWRMWQRKDEQIDRKELMRLGERVTQSQLILRSYIDVVSHQSRSTVTIRYAKRYVHRSPLEVDVLNWLSKSDPEATQADLRDRCLRSSGSWLSRTKEYTNWQQQELSMPHNILWLPGTAGSGKTYLTSFVIDDLQQRYSFREDTRVVYFYCDYRQQSIYSAAYILSTLLKQLISSLQPFPESLTNLFTSYRHGADSPSKPRLEDIRNEFLKISRVFNHVFVVVDALDECGSACQAEFLHLIPDFPSSVRILITSRPEEDIARVLDKCPQITLVVEDDVWAYIVALFQRTHFSAVIAASLKKSDEREQEMKHLVDSVYRKCRGSFLVANLQVQRISKLHSLREIQEELSRLPSSLFELYTQILEMIHTRSPADREQIIKILLWIFKAKRPLLVRELQQALSTSPTVAQGVLTASTMVDLCLGLVTVDEERSTIRFLHFSVQEFLQKGHFILNDDESTLAITCLTFLNLEPFASGQCNNNQELEHRLQEFPFLDYAARYWAIHGKDSNRPEVEQLAVKFLCSERHLACATQVAESNRDGYNSLSPRKQSGLHVIASFGLVQLIDIFLRQSQVKVDAKDEQGQTPLLCAAKQGNTNIIEILAQKGAQVDNHDSIHLRSALSWATLNGHTPTVKWLLSQGSRVNINSFDYQHSTPLHLAFERHHYDIVDLLVAQGASLNDVDQWQRTQAQLAFSGSSLVDFDLYKKDYKLTKIIAQGGQARVSVFRKKDTNGIHHPYTILFRKAFDTTGDEGSETLRLLVQERDYLRNLHHPNIVKFIGYKENEEHTKAYLWTEYCDGGDLSKFVRKDFGNGTIIEPRRNLTKQDVWRIFADIVAAVSYLHYGVIKENNSFSLKTDWRPFIHRDIKPANVVIQDSGAYTSIYKLCDLGIAKLWDPAMNQTRKGRGTVAYMPKEVKEQLKHWTIKGDIYSIGATIRDLAKDFSDKTLEDLITQCTDDSPSKRPSSLTLLQISRKELAAEERKEIPLFLPDRPAEMDYLQQAIYELLERLFHSFKSIKTDLREHLIGKLDTLLEDARLRSSDCWGLDKCLPLLLALGKEEKARALVLCKEASWNGPWNMHGLTPKDIAAHDELSILNLLGDNPSNTLQEEAVVGKAQAYAPELHFSRS